jgi:hypothetical protein
MNPPTHAPDPSDQELLAGYVFIPTAAAQLLALASEVAPVPRLFLHEWALALRVISSGARIGAASPLSSPNFA